RPVLRVSARGDRGDLSPCRWSSLLIPHFGSVAGSAIGWAPTKVPFKTAAPASRQSMASCQRRAITVASITSSSETPVPAFPILVSASRAGGTGGCPFGLATYAAATLASNPPSHPRPPPPPP